MTCMHIDVHMYLSDLVYIFYGKKHRQYKNAVCWKNTVKLKCSNYRTRKKNDK